MLLSIFDPEKNQEKKRKKNRKRKSKNTRGYTLKPRKLSKFVVNDQNDK